MSTIGVDFDGVIHAYRRGWHDGTIYDDPVPGSFEALLKLMDSYSVFIFTSRDPDSVRRWIVSRMGIPCTLVCHGKFWNTREVLLVTNRKYPATAYVDDRAIRFIDWEQTLSELSEF